MSLRSLTNWTNKWNKLSRRAPGRSPARRPRLPLRLELLEDRLAPATFTVNTIQDTLAVNLTTGQDASGKVSLRSAIMAANNLGGTDTITFANALTQGAPATITLSNGPLTLANANGTTIQGPGANLLTIDGSQRSSVFFVNGSASSVVLSGLTIAHGNAYYGGGVYNYYGTVAISNCTLSANSATYGGGICNFGTLTVSNSTFCPLTVSSSPPSGNSAINEGGGIFNTGGLTVSNSTLSGNSASYFGGGIINVGSLTVNNSTLSGNSATNRDGGGICNFGTLTVGSSTLSGNSSLYGNGGGIYNASTMNLSNTIVANSPSGGDIYSPGTIASAQNNLIQSAAFNGLQNGQNGNIVGQNPLLTPLPDYYGGPTQTFALLPASPALGHGAGTTMSSSITSTTTSIVLANAAVLGIVPNVTALLIDSEQVLVTAINNNTLTVTRGVGGTAAASHNSGANVLLATDQRGLARISGGTVDIGAFQTQPLVVNTTADPVVANTPPADSAATPFGQLSLRQAITLANVRPGSDSITFDPTVFSTAQTITLAGGVLALSDTSGTTTIFGPSASLLTIDGKGASGVFSVNPGVTAELDSLTIAHGNTGYGGGIYNSGTLTVGNSILSTNSAYDGGGIYNKGTLILDNSILSTNPASDSGGGILNNGALTVSNSSFSSNSANTGGGIFNYAGTVTVSNSTLSGNSASIAGGGIYNNATLTVSSSTLYGNSATSTAQGGGIYNYLGMLMVGNSTLSANSAYIGGGIFNNLGTLKVGNSTLSGNSASSAGGGIYTGGTLDLTNTIVAKSAGGQDLLNGGTIHSAQNNLIQSAAGHNIQNGINGNIVGVDPLLYPLSNYGGPTQTFALRSHSPALAAGSTALIPIDPATGVTYTTDQRGQPRLRAGTVDIGAVEIVGNPYQVTTTADTGPGSLRDAITQVDADTSHTLYASPINPNIDEIDFAITAGSDTGGGYNSLTGVATIAPQSGLPGITSAVMIDGWSQPGFAGTPLIELNGAAAGNVDGLDIGAVTTVRGLVINRFSGAGIGVYGTSSAGTWIYGNYIGVDPTGTIGEGNLHGILLDSVNLVTIGSNGDGVNDVLERNVISGHNGSGWGGEGVRVGRSTNVTIKGNYLGTNAKGDAAIANQDDGVRAYDDSNLRIIGNVMSGGSGYGVILNPNVDHVVIQGNLIGTNAAGTAALGDTFGIYMIGNIHDVTIGGTTPGTGNLISGNSDVGVSVADYSCYNITLQGNFIGTDVTGTYAIANQGGGVGAAGGNILIGGTVPGAGNLIAGNSGAGIAVDNASSSLPNFIEGNRIGTNAAGNSTTGSDGKPLGNGYGVFLGGFNTTVGGNVTIGGTVTGAGNLISGNLGGIAVGGANNLVEGNYIGTDATGTKALPNGNGVLVQGTTNDLINNLVSGNNGYGVFLIFGASNVIQGNLIGTDATGNVALANQGPGVHVLASQYILIGGPGSGQGNLISGNTGDGIYIEPSPGGPSSHNTVQGNRIGTNAAGNSTTGSDGRPLGNGFIGVRVYDQNNLIGGSGPGEGNIISGNLIDGIGIAATGNVVSGNFIGTDASGRLNLGNGDAGVVVADAAGDTIGGAGAGAGNTIAYNSKAGVLLQQSASSITISGNSIHDNGGLGIDLGPLGGNNGQAAPVLTAASGSGIGATISGTLASVANTTFRIEFFSNQSPNSTGSGDGVTFLGFITVTTDGSGKCSFTASLSSPVPQGQGYISATATNLSTNDTSAFANDVVAAIDPITVHVAASSPFQIANEAVLSLSATGATSSEIAAGLTYNVNWGDGTQVRTVGGSNITVPHQYAQDGFYSVGVSVTDVNGGGSSATALVVLSTLGSDSIVVSGGATAGQVAVSSHHGSSSGIFNPTDLVYVSDQVGSGTYTVNFGSTLTTPMSIFGSGSTDSLVVNGSLSSNNFITKTSTYVTWGINPSPAPPSETVSYSGIQHKIINSNGYRNVISDPGGDTTINGGPGDNTITVTATTGNGVVINGGPATNTYIADLGSLAGPVSIANSSTTAGDSLVVNGAAGNNTIAAAGNQVTSGTQTITDTASLASLAINGGSGNNQVSVSALTVPVQNLALNGGGGTNTFTLNNVGSTVGSLAISSGSGGPGTTVVQIQGSLPTVTGQQLPPLVSMGPNSTVDAWMPFTSTGSFSDTGTGATYTATVNYGDGSGAQPLALAANNSFILGHAYASPGVYTVTVGVSDQYGTGSSTLAVTVRPLSIYVLNAKASGALSISGHASINVSGKVVVDSSSTKAIQASGHASITGSIIDVVGGVKTTDSASLSPAPTTGISPFADPLAGLVAPAAGTSQGSVRLSKGSKTINPGTYSQIEVSGNASLTLSPGIYVITGGGFSVTGNASVSGSGVLIFNAGSSYPCVGGDDFGGITFSGNGKFGVSPATSGPYAGIVIYQARNNTRAINLGGNAIGNILGTIYAPNALLNLKGDASLGGSAVVGTLNLGGSTALTQTAAGSDGSGDVAGIANTLFAGDLSVYINDPSGLFTADELARIQDAINTWDTLLAPYHVTITEVSDPTLATIVIDTGSTSACGGMANSVLGCFNAPAGEITLIQGWNWYPGADPTQIAAGQYDFETTMLHELGHALGLGGATDPTSPMYESLAAGATNRTVTVADLNISDAPAGADPQLAAPSSGTLQVSIGVGSGSVWQTNAGAGLAGVAAGLNPFMSSSQLDPASRPANSLRPTVIPLSYRPNATPTDTRLATSPGVGAAVPSQSVEAAKFTSATRQAEARWAPRRELIGLRTTGGGLGTSASTFSQEWRSRAATSPQHIDPSEPVGQDHPEASVSDLAMAPEGEIPVDKQAVDWLSTTVGLVVIAARPAQALAARGRRRFFRDVSGKIVEVRHK